MMNGPIDGEINDECRCGCHYAQEDAIIMHCMACCYQCPNCHKNISTLFHDEHKSKCKEVLGFEVQFFNENRKKWFKYHEGKFALVKGTTLYGFYDNADNAYEVGVNVWGGVDFLIKDVQLVDNIVWM